MPFTRLELVFDVGPQSLQGVELGTPAIEATEQLLAILGPPVRDTGWNEGCPLDDVDERYLFWGGLTVSFKDSRAGRQFDSWWYDLDYDTGGSQAGGPTFDQIRLPGGLQLGAPMTDAAALYGFTPEVDATGQQILYHGDGFRLTSNADPSSPIRRAAVPHALTYCE